MQKLNNFHAALFCFLLVGGLAATAHVVFAEASEPRVRKAQTGFPWLAGSWRMRGEEVVCDEYWSEPRGGTQFGAFRLTKGDKTAFYELFSIEKAGGKTVLCLRHFSRGLVPWKQEKDGPTKWVLETKGENHAVFASESSTITYRLASRDKLVVTLAARPADPKRVQKFEFSRR
ncbi:MAG: DUF6265 family protein [Planctomycetota bacterium]|jgi:hypothetical protein